METVLLTIALIVGLLLMGYSVWIAIKDYRRDCKVIEEIRSRRRNVSLSQHRPDG